ncbi:MAG TPA: DUF302 domain-containing protein [Symbiobacteriaceae bacterium]|nr:DUF302 domain-containing protein [Symbiobacteriaceae bacterium]
MSNVQYHFTRETGKTVPQAIAALEAALPKRKFSVLWHLDMNAKLKEKGQETDRVFHVFEVCSAPHAKVAIETNLEVGYFLPCKMVIYEKDGKTHVGLLRPNLLMDMLGEQRLQNLANLVETELSAVVDEVACE